MSLRAIENFVDTYPSARPLVNGAVTVASVFLCLLILPLRLPGMELAGISPNWLLIWVVAWSVKRVVWQGAMAGLILGLLQDGMTAPEPTHAIGLMIVGALTAKLQKQRYVQEDFISVALIVFLMAVISETITALQFSFLGERSLSDIWTYHQFIALSSAILSSLWAPVVYFPLNRWWEMMGIDEQS
ncbi:MULTISPECIES: rod shape-determining protein MreD [Leptolyngbya]|jgi:rod shape-determining protein MreD|uniref:Rod shape-determining protein MreD n=2 Tax=Leptolyngbya boryana TaxID=1184 RepID=A0AA96WTG9_LEPBY|nr:MULTISPECIES: rod shape-determining protein MreD [Leptolyngbya]BAY55750.1 PEP-CTERM putative exosortase interaction domain protein [Leptolyngbya boryana NIES-2135]MBD2370356.1 rod shape-determining protein MreD [Leptolyngbya sp. FACHB-161]MBD2376700.1 rod shape-determining protein MreD [Leptolyngbya sp. FACHB-238]MBD2400970.1 rod shape-determining protein MreD [Leptolyngbya sp. FACHB-239]MBD2407618.1 rod shape-determining protein MreD [Leptolyngbya sp. FACHB-402]